MINSNLYFELPSYSEIGIQGDYSLYVTNHNLVDFTAKLLSGEDYVTIKSIHSGVLHSYIEIEILEQEKDFSIQISDNAGNSDVLYANTGKADYALNIDKVDYDVVYTGGTIEIPYSLAGYTSNDITIDVDIQEVYNGVSYLPLYTPKGDEFGTMCIYYDYGTTLLVEPPGGSVEELDCPIYIVYDTLKADNEEVRVQPSDPSKPVYIGYHKNENVIINKIEHDKLNQKIIVSVAPNTLGEDIKQSFIIRCGAIAKSVEITLQYNPDGIFFDYSHDHLDTLLGLGSLSRNLDISKPLKFNVDVIFFNGNAFNVPDPYTVTYQERASFIDTTIQRIGITYRNTSLRITRTLPQSILFQVGIYDKRYSQKYYKYYKINLEIDAPGTIYGAGSIYINSDNEATGALNLHTNNAIEVEIADGPEWITQDNIILSDNKVTLQNVGYNLTKENRSYDLELRFKRANNTYYANTLIIPVTQEPNGNVINNVHKTFEDFYIYPEGAVLSIYKTDDNTSIYNGLTVDKINLTEFANYLFTDKKSIFDSSFVKLNLLKGVKLSIDGGEFEYHNYIYDYSNDKSNNFNITELKQAIDYYDSRQYIFESIFNYPSNYSNYKLNDRTYYNMSDYEKYNITLPADSAEEMQLSYEFYGNRYYGKKYTRKCTNANYAVYYMNTYGGWNWMLFESNKQTKKLGIKQSTFLTTNSTTKNYNVNIDTTYDLTSLFLTDEGSAKLQDLYVSPIIYLHDFSTNELILVNVVTSSYTLKTYLNQGRKMFTQSITLKEAKNTIKW